jgi:hypothetical protein
VLATRTALDRCGERPASSAELRRYRWQGGRFTERGHCLNGNLLRALIGFGWLEDEWL